VPTPYDLSYYSQVNKGIRSCNEKLREITKEHKQVALTEMDIDRKYHTRHGLHFNQLRKLLFSNKISQMIYLILGDKQKQGTVVSEVDGRSSNQIKKGIRNNEGIIKLTQNGVDKNGEEEFNQNEDETTSDNSDDKNGEVRFSLFGGETSSPLCVQN
jgi:hypothetical protein